MSSLIRRSAGALACVVVASMTVQAAPAQAETTVTKDRNLDNRKNFKKVTVAHREKRVRFTSRVFDQSDLPEWVYHEVDTGGDRKPEFAVSAIVKTDNGSKPQVGVSRIDTWLPRENPWKGMGKFTDCGLQVASKRDHGNVLRILTGRGCFRTDGKMPTRLRVTTFFGYVEFPETADPVPAWRTYGDWTSAG